MKITLQPASIRGDRIIPLHEDTCALDRQGLIDLLGIRGQSRELNKLQFLRRGSYLGISKGSRTGALVVFVITPPAGAPHNSLTWVLEQDVNFPSRVQSMYRIEELELDGLVIEERSSEDRMPPNYPGS